MLESVWVKLPYVLFIVGLVGMHMEYVHRRRVAYSRGFILFQLACDLIGFLTTWLVLGHYRPEERWIPWFLGIHAAVHVASLAWALAHWESLRAHMLDFQARRLHPVFQTAEFLYEQSDTALYVAAVAIVAVTLPTWAIMVGIVAVSAGIAAWRPTAGFASAPAEAA